MAIRFACACGASIQAPDELAGRRVRCPRRGKAATVPAVTVPVEGALTVVSIGDLAGGTATELDPVARKGPAPGGAGNSAVLSAPRRSGSSSRTGRHSGD
ncbi:MAG: hypothetical protein HY720_06125 [Planctomycetes bacterium]|nr:hypothetical protein [Planctomycetota bacterium]